MKNDCRTILWLEYFGLSDRMRERSSILIIGICTLCLVTTTDKFNHILHKVTDNALAYNSQAFQTSISQQREPMHHYNSKSNCYFTRTPRPGPGHGVCENMFSSYKVLFDIHQMPYNKEIEECGLTIKSKRKRTIIDGKVSKIRATGGWHPLPHQLFNTHIENYPWSVLIRFHIRFKVVVEILDKAGNYVEEEATFLHVYPCTGNIIHRQFILTAAHCLHERYLLNIMLELEEEKYVQINKQMKSTIIRNNGKFLGEFDRIKLNSWPSVTTDFLNANAKISILYGKVTRSFNNTMKRYVWKGDERVIIEQGAYFNHTSVHPGFIPIKLRRYLPKQNTIPQMLVANKNDLAIIYLPQEIHFNSRVRPICLPGYNSLRHMDSVREYENCAPLQNEMFYQAGYGATNDVPPDKSPYGINAGKFKVKNIHYETSHFFNSYLESQILPHLSMDDIEDYPNFDLLYGKTQNSKGERVHKVLGSGTGDSGSAAAFTRTIIYKQGNREKYFPSRYTALSILSCCFKCDYSKSRSGSEFGPNLLIDIDWVANEMAHFYTHGYRKIEYNL